MGLEKHIRMDTNVSQLWCKENKPKPHRSGSFLFICSVLQHFFCIIISLFGVRHKSPLAVALSVLQFYVHILFFDNCTYLKVKRKIPEQNLYFLQSDIV